LAEWGFVPRCGGPTRAEDFGLGAHVEKTEARNGQFARPVRLAVTEVIAIRLASMPLYQVELLNAAQGACGTDQATCVSTTAVPPAPW